MVLLLSFFFFFIGRVEAHLASAVDTFHITNFALVGDKQLADREARHLQRPSAAALQLILKTKDTLRSTCILEVFVSQLFKQTHHLSFPKIRQSIFLTRSFSEKRLFKTFLGFKLPSASLMLCCLFPSASGFGGW